MVRTKRSNFLELKNEWYERLKKEGFHDIEDHREHIQSGSTKRRFEERHQEYSELGDCFAAKRRYFELAESFLNSYAFRSPLHQFIWQYHTEGLSLREIIGKLPIVVLINQYKPLSVRAVFLIVKQYQKMMFDRNGLDHDEA